MRLVLDHAEDTVLGRRGLAMSNPHFMGDSATGRTNALKVPVMRDAIITESLGDDSLADQLVPLGTINNRIIKTVKRVCVVQSKPNQSNHKMELYIQQ